MMMKTFAELGTVHRGEPCQEYPGEWIVYYPFRKIENNNRFASFQQAFAFARSISLPPDGHKISIFFKCSDDDPRIGEVWFSGYYQVGEIDSFGRYKET
jgi:hypothetical protein